MGLPRGSICRACTSSNYVPLDIAIALRLVEAIMALRAIVADGHRRPGWRRIREVLSQAERPIRLSAKRKRRGKRARRVKPMPLPAIEPVITTPSMPTSQHPAGPAPQGCYWQLQGFTWMAKRIDVRDDRGPI